MHTHYDSKARTTGHISDEKIRRMLNRFPQNDSSIAAENYFAVDFVLTETITHIAKRLYGRYERYGIIIIKSETIFRIEKNQSSIFK